MPDSGVENGYLKSATRRMDYIRTNPHYTVGVWVGNFAGAPVNT